VTRVEARSSERSTTTRILPVVYVTADVAGREESPVYAVLKLNEAIDRLALREGYKLERYVASQPSATDRLSMKWDGDWHISTAVSQRFDLSASLRYFLSPASSRIASAIKIPECCK